jgi:hypothetical protein
VTFSTWAEAEAALTAVDGLVTLPGSSHALAVKFADAKPGELAKFEARAAGTKRGAGEMGGGAAGAAAMMGMMGGGGDGSSGGKRQFMGGMGRGGMVRLGWDWWLLSVFLQSDRRRQLQLWPHVGVCSNTRQPSQ